MRTKDDPILDNPTNGTRNAAATDRPDQRPWISPEFERIPMNEALANTLSIGDDDGAANYAS